MRTLVASVAAATMIALAACGEDDPGGPSNSDIAGFELRRGGTPLVAWDGSVGAADTVRLQADDSIAVEFGWLNAAGSEVDLPASAELAVTTSNMGVARWVPHPSNESLGSFVTGDLLQPVSTAMQVVIEVEGDVMISTSLIPVKVSP